jgi:hypothetical protein
MDADRDEKTERERLNETGTKNERENDLPAECLPAEVGSTRVETSRQEKSY